MKVIKLSPLGREKLEAFRDQLLNLGGSDE